METLYRWIREVTFPYRPLPTSISHFKHLHLLASGASGIVYAIDNSRVIKQYMKPNDTERLAFSRIGSHPHIVKFLGSLSDGSILLERGTLLRHTLNRNYNNISLYQKIQWLKEAAEALRYIHQIGIVHADVGCHNMILVDQRLKLIDFEGCSIDKSQPSSSYEWFSCPPPDVSVSQHTDIFAYGCVVYEVVTGKPPYHEYTYHENRIREVQLLRGNNQFPEVGELLCGKLIEDCWKGNLRSMSEVISELGLQTQRIHQVRNDAGWTIWGRTQQIMQYLSCITRQIWRTRRRWFSNFIAAVFSGPKIAFLSKRTT